MFRGTRIVIRQSDEQQFRFDPHANLRGVEAAEAEIVPQLGVVHTHLQCTHAAKPHQQGSSWKPRKLDTRVSEALDMSAEMAQSR